MDIVISAIDVIVFIFIDMYAFIVAILGHPNTPAYIQAGAVIIATVAGLNYLSRRKAERKFDLVVKAHKDCLVAIDVLQRVKQSPIVFKTREEVTASVSNSKELFLKSVAFFADSYQSILKEEHEVFEELYDCYSEMRLFFHGKDETLKPIENLLYARNRIMELLENLKLCHYLIQDLMPEHQDGPVKTAVNAMVQIWEDIELDEQQKQEQDREEEKGVRKFYYLNDLIKNARNDIDKIFPKLIAK